MYKCKEVNKNYFKKWSSDMAYVLGFLFADGNITINKRGANYLAFYSMDKEILKFIQESMKSNHKISRRNFRSGNVFRIQIGSKEIIKDLFSLGLSNLKTSRMKLPKIPFLYLKYFILGYFDGDGNVWIGEINKKRKNKTLIIQTAFTSASKEFLIGLHIKLKELGIKGGFIYKIKNKKCFRLILSIEDSLKFYKIVYNTIESVFCLKKKRKVFEKYIKMRA